MRHILIVLLIICLHLSAKSQVVRDTIYLNSSRYSKIDSIRYESNRKIEERFNSFYAENRQSQVLYGIGVGLAGIGLLGQNIFDKKFTNVLYGCAAVSFTAGFCLYIDSYNYFNPRKKNKKKSYFINYLVK